MAKTEMTKDPKSLPQNIETGIAIKTDAELQVASSGAYAIQEIQASMIMAKRFPRDFDRVWAAVMKACQRKTLAQVATYSYPRSNTIVSGPSVYLARVTAGYFGNLRFGVDILRDDENSRLVRGWCWDIETNTKVSFDDDFQKLIYRKKEGWIKPDERDLRELTHRRGAILMRNAIFNVVPRDLVEDALWQARQTLKSEITDPDSEKKRLILELDKVGVTVEMINAYLGHGVWDQDDIVEVQGILNAIKEGAAKRDEFFGTEIESTPVNGSLKQENMKAGDPAKHQGHEPQKEDRPVGHPRKEKETELTQTVPKETKRIPDEVVARLKTLIKQIETHTGEAEDRVLGRVTGGLIRYDDLEEGNIEYYLKRATAILADLARGVDSGPIDESADELPLDGERKEA